MYLRLPHEMVARFFWLALFATFLGCSNDSPRGKWHLPQPRPVSNTSSSITPQPAVLRPAANSAGASPSPVAAKNPFEPRKLPVAKLPRSPANFADWNQNKVVQWKTDLGEGGLELPLVAESTRQIPAEHRFTRVLGIYLPPESEDIVFIGTYDPARPQLDPEDLLDALAVAYRTWWQGEQRAVSIDPPPPPKTFANPHNVRFFGGIGGTNVGFVAFESDRLMKCLSLGADNITKQPFTCNVAGFQNKFALLRKFPGTGNSQHRFWFEPKSPRAAEAGGRRLIVAESTLRVQTKDESSGKDVAADQASQAFADQLTDHFDAYAADDNLEVFSRMHAHAVLFAIAGKLQGEAAEKAGSNAPSNRNPHLPSWLAAGHAVRKVNILPTTPALSRTEAGSTLRSLQTITGGVRLDADHPAAWVNSPAEAIFSELQEQMSKAPQSRYWRWNARAQSYGAVRLGKNAELKAWHQDFTTPHVQLIRETVSPSGPFASELGSAWKLRLPRLQFSQETSQTTDNVVWPAYARVENGLGETVILSQPGSMRVQGGTVTNTLTSRDGRRGALFFKNGIVYYEGDVQLQEQNGLAIMPAGTGSRAIFFGRDAADTASALSAEAKYRAERVQTFAAATVEYAYDQSRLKTIAVSPTAGGATQTILSFQHDAQGRISEAVSNSGETRFYRYGAEGELLHVFDKLGQRLSYRYDIDTSNLVALGARLSGQMPDLAQIAIENESPTRAEVRSASPRLQLMEAFANRSPQQLISVDGGEHSTIPNLEDRHGLSSQEVDQLYKVPLKKMMKNEAEVILVSGDIDTRHQLAAVVAEIDPQKVVVATQNPLAAAPKLADDGTAPQLNNRLKLISAEEWFDKDATIKGSATPLRPVMRSLIDQLNDSKADIVLVAGHRDEPLLAGLTQVRNEGGIAGKCVILLTCSTRSPKSDAGLVEEIIENNAVLTVSRSPRLLNQQELPEIIEKIRAGLQQLEPQVSPSDILRAINQALQGIEGVELHHQARTRSKESRQMAIKRSRSPQLSSSGPC